MFQHMFPLLFIACSSLAVATPAAGQALSVGDEDPVLVALSEKIDRFFENLISTNLDQKDAFEDLLAGGPVAGQDDKIKELVTKTKEFDDKFGKYHAHERITADRVGKDLVMLKYLYKAENHPVVWYFTYYRDLRQPEASSESGSWTIIAVRFDTRIDLLGL